MKALNANTGRSLWGFGMETFYDLHLTGPFLGKADHPFLSCDSAWIEVMVETGYVGLALFALILFSAAFQAYRAKQKVSEEYRALAWVFFVCMFSYYFMMTSVAMYAWGQNGYMLWMIIALLYALLKVSKTEHSVSAPETTSAEKLSRRLATRQDLVRTSN
jgi:O-antigen ligase